MGYLDGKSVVVTGGGGAIGEAYARLAAAEGAVVVVCDIKDADTARVAEEINASGGTALLRTGDVTDWRQAEALVDFCVAETGKLDGFLNNAALFHMSWAGEEDEEKLRRLIDVNVIGVAACGNFAIRQMRKQGTGSLVNIVSGAYLGMRYAAAYSASKGAVASFTHSWTLENDDVPGIRVNAISPMGRRRVGPKMSDGYEEIMAASVGNVAVDPGVQRPEPEDNAPVAVFLLSDSAADVKGQIVHIQGRNLGLIAHPKLADPVVPNDGRWTVAGVEEEFRTTFSDKLVPTGRSRAWTR